MGTPRKHVVIYTDGACSGNPGPGGWAAILRYNQHEKVLQGAEAHTTNNRMELTAVIKALQALKEPCRVDVYTDSNYIVRAFQEGWVERWQRNGWRTASKKPVENQDLWRALLELTRRHDVRFLKVKGHADDALNNRVDRLAVEAMRRGQTETPDSSVSAVND
ncbi:ribonuclease HI [Rhodothermus marinus]|uniref:ribonuclease HI n=1 Tax=Rhodothermus marinus TaxID=29549 RepID=UPI0012BA3F57|nr:ribonuclease HI [Rhodothermus marinus]BBM70308.1 ribonuclease H [Rhodothermus marinus]BBM73295.1 ribonuclease H [Rhodothermus marinus]